MTTLTTALLRISTLIKYALIKCTPIKYILSVTVLTVFCTPAFSFDIPNQSIRYAVTYLKIYVGELETLIENDGSTIKTTSVPHLSAIAKIFLPTQTAETWFDITEQGLLVDRGHIIDQDNKIHEQYEIDRDAGTIQFHHGETPTRETQPTAQSDLFEATGIPMVLMSSEDIARYGGREIREISPKKVSWYQYHEPQSEILKLNGKSYQTWKITRNKRGKPERTQTFWLDRNNFQIPLKVLSIKGKKQTVYTLLTN